MMPVHSRWPVVNGGQPVPTMPAALGIRDLEQISPEQVAQGMAEFASRANLSTEEFVTVTGQMGLDAEAFRDFVEKLAKSGVLDPEGGALEAGPGLYGQLMRNLSTSMSTCLSQ